MRRKWFEILYLLLSGIGFFHDAAAIAEPIHAEAIIEKQILFVGESASFQIRVTGSDNPEKPDIARIEGLDIEYQGGQQNSSSSITIINGNITKTSQKGYIFTYQLTPTKNGRIVIPEISVHADGQTLLTNPVMITAQEPEETDDFKLRLQLEKLDCYVGEAVPLTVTWYLGKDVRGFHFNLPLLEDSRLSFEDTKVNTQDGKKYYRIPVGNGEVVGVMGQGRVDGGEYSTLSFQKILIPKESGDIVIKPVTVASEVLTGFRPRNNPFGNDFFSDDFFGKTQSGIYRKVVVPSNSITLHVHDLPPEGRPEHFFGHVGEYKIRAEASPTDVSVGDPITLKIALSGPEYLENMDFPTLDHQEPLKKDFKIPKERAAGEMVGHSKVFTQTIRALRPGITQIPPLMLSYFDPETKQYRKAESDPIPISVKAARIVTAQDAEGIATPLAESGNRVETWSAGIDYNYDDMSVLEDKRFGLLQWLRSPVWISIVGFPPFLYLVLFVGITYKKRMDADPLARRARGAYSRFQITLRAIRKDSSGRETARIILESFRQYLTDKLRMRGGVVTFNDVKGCLKDRKVDLQTCDELRDLFEKIEAGSYSGNISDIESLSLVRSASDLVQRLEKKL